MSLVDELFDWLDACLSTYFPQEYVRAPVTDRGKSRALCHNSSWKSEQWMCRYTCKMVGGVHAGQCTQVRLSLVKENYHIKWSYNLFIKVLSQTYCSNLLFEQAFVVRSHSAVNTFTASYLNTQGLNNSCLKSPASTLVDHVTFQSRALRSFSLNQLRNLSL